ncbi:O-methyltransferase involved in polyketide biosynthesis [Prauserella shujinwangii]|uniref:O-methyltransferase involved in polyketide biosynthesis n=1 Tax=Prauserella shujinwangii TaxID=1453103 RepID=A0A2T0LL40_9PSEU|nr:class I SAM-dependent methyltransferase [Prauserella shujinwangii]PRX43669.1 O-methyltransferase involved in polyketide biosynthesis [Prauserella shujinwangii]
MRLRRGPDAISPTGHYTGYVWVRHGLAPGALATPEGRALYYAAEPAMRLSRAAGGPTFEGVLLARHQVLDTLLAQAVERGEIGQVVEVAAGLSARGHRFAERFGPALTYVETDLPGMAGRKRALLDRLGGTGPHHRVAELDALRDTGPDSLAALADTLDPDTGTAILTEGLLNYFDRAAVTAMWRRFATVLARFPRGTYLADLHLREQAGAPAHRLGAGLVGAFVRGRVHFHFADRAEAEAELRAAGFATASVRGADDLAGRPGDRSARLAGIVAARTARD